MIINESTLEIGPGDILIHKSGRKYKVLKPFNGYVTLLSLDNKMVHRVKNDVLTTKNYKIED